MVGNYKKKTSRSELNETNIQKAISDILHKREYLTSAAVKYGINRTTLQSRLKKHDPLQWDSDLGNGSNEIRFHSKYCSKQVLSKAHEDELVSFIKECVFYQYGLTHRTCRKLVYQYVKHNKIRNPSKWDIDKEASEEWMRGFRQRNPTLLSKPERTNLMRIKALDKTVVDNFFENLKTVYERYSFQAKDIFNLDESEFSTALESPNASAPEDQRTNDQIPSADCGNLVTIVGIVNAIGDHLPPIYVFPCQEYNDRFLDGGLTDSIGLASESGEMIPDLFIEVVKHIQRYTNCSADQPVLILLDNHWSHCSLDSIIFAKENGIILLPIPPHTSHRLQPLDVSVFGPFKKFCQKSFNYFLWANEGKQITIDDIAKLTNQPFEKAFSAKNITNGFIKTGIHPFNSKVFTDELTVEEESAKESSLDVQIKKEITESDDSQPVSLPNKKPRKAFSSLNANRFWNQKSTFWSMRQMVILIREIENNPLLYDKTHPHYYNTAQRLVTLKKITETLKPHKPNVTQLVVKKKLQMLRLQHLREEKEIKLLGQTHSYKPKLWCYDMLKFFNKENNVTKSTTECVETTLSRQTEPPVIIKAEKEEEHLENSIDVHQIANQVQIQEQVNGLKNRETHNLLFNKSLQLIECLSKKVQDLKQIEDEYCAPSLQPPTSSLGQMVESELKCLSADLYYETKWKILHVLEEASNRNQSERAGSIPISIHASSSLPADGKESLESSTTSDRIENFNPHPRLVVRKDLI